VVRRRSTAIGPSIMFPVNNSAPPITTKTNPRLNVTPVTTVTSPPHTSAFSPAEATMASNPPNAIYAPARNPPTNAFAGPSAAFVVPEATASSAVSAGVL